MSRGKRAVLIAIATATAVFLLTEVAIAHKAMSDDDDLIITDDSQLESESGEATGSSSDSLTQDGSEISQQEASVNQNKASSAKKEPFDPVVFA